MSQVLFYQAKNAGGAVAAYRIVKPAGGGKFVQAAAAADLLVGVSGRVPAEADGDRVEIAVVGIADVEYGGAVNPGQPVTSDADGKAVAAAANNRTVGICLLDATAADGVVGPLLIAQGTV